MMPGIKDSFLKNVQIVQMGLKQGTGKVDAEVEQSVGTATQEKSGSAWCGLLVYNQYLSTGRMSPKCLLEKYPIWKEL